MSTETEELVRICESLPVEKRQEVADFARFLLTRSEDEAWERSIAEARPRPRLEAFMRESAREGEEPLDENRL